MNTTTTPYAEGRCTCGDVRYQLLDRPLFVHCCHCTWCQRETGSAFALNALIEQTAFAVMQGEPEAVAMPSNSGKGQEILRCPRCKVALWSHYGAAGDKVKFVRVGTLANPGLCPPDLHIFTSTKLPWVQLPLNTPVVEEYYQRSKYWPAEAVERYKSALA